MPISLENEILGGMLVANILKVIEVFFSKKDEKKKNPVRPKTRLEMNAVGMERDWGGNIQKKQGQYTYIFFFLKEHFVRYSCFLKHYKITPIFLVFVIIKF